MIQLLTETELIPERSTAMANTDLNADVNSKPTVLQKTSRGARTVQSRPDHLCHIPDLIFETVHPNDPEHFFIFQQFTAEQYCSSTLTYEEAIKEVLSNPIHQHDHYELLYVIRGEMYQIIENKRHLYPQGSLCLMNRNICHQEEFSTDFQTVFLSIPARLMDELTKNEQELFFDCEKDLISRFCQMFFWEQFAISGPSSLHAYIDFLPVTDQPLAQERMNSLFRDLVEEYTSPTIGSTYRIKYLLICILQHLLETNHYTSIPLRFVDPELELLDDITALLRLHNGRLTRQELADMMHYSGHYLNRIVKKHTNMSLQQYSMTFTMQAVGAMLIMTKMTIEEICQLLHFSNQTHFYKAFQEYYKMTPKQYRRQNKLKK